MASENTQQTLFRKKSIDRVSSPEQLNEYIRVANPSVWVLMAAVVILLVGVCVWGVTGHLDTTIPAVAVVENGETTLYIHDSEISQVQAGMPVILGDAQCAIAQIPAAPVLADAVLSDYALHVGGLQAGRWVYAASVSGDLADGVYSAKIVVESVSPMSFVLN